MGRRVRSGPPTGLVSDGFRRLGLAVADHLLILGLLSNTWWAAPAARVMIGDRQVDDVSCAKAAGMRAVWRRNDRGFPAAEVVPDAVVDRMSELPALLRSWGGA